MIIVRPGIYYENINFKGKNISLVSEHYFNLGDTQLIKDTIIDGRKKRYRRSDAKWGNGISRRNDFGIYDSKWAGHWD